MLVVAGCRGRAAAPGATVKMLAWSSSKAAGEEVVARDDLKAVEVRQALAEAFVDLVPESDTSAVVGKVLARDVQRGNLVRVGDLSGEPPAAVVATRPDSAPTTQAAPRPYGGLPVGDPAEVEAKGLYEKYVTTPRMARDEQVRNFEGAPPNTSPMGLTTQPLGVAGVTPLKEDAPEVIVPEGATRLYGFRQKLPDGVNETFAYSVSGDAGTIANFYQTRLPPIGYKWVKAADGGGEVQNRYMTFVKGRQSVYFVNLHPADKGKVKVVLMISRLNEKP